MLSRPVTDRAVFYLYERRHMRKILLFLVLLLLSCSPALANKPADSAGFWPYFTAAHDYAVYEGATEESSVVAILKPGADISLQDYGVSAKIGNVWGNWYKVMYVQGNDIGTGYIWSGEGLINRSLMYGEQRFVYEVTHDEETYLSAVVLKAFDKNGKLLDQTPAMQVSFEIANNIIFTALDGDGLEGVAFIAQIYMTAEACGFPSYKMYYAWTDDKLVPLPEAVTMGGEGIYTSFDESVIFPSGGAPYNTIVKVICAYEPLGEDGYETKDTFAAEIYRWDGKQAVMQKQDPATLNWRTTKKEE